MTSASMGEKATSGVVCAGNWIVDIVNTVDHWPEEGNLAQISDVHVGVGGGAANVSTNLRYLDPELPIAASGCVGKDSQAGVVRGHCRDLDIDQSQLYTVDNARTATTQVMSVPGKTRTFFYDPGANDLFDLSHVSFEVLIADGYRTFYLGYPMLLGALDAMQADGKPQAAALLAMAERSGMLTCVDLVSSKNENYETIVRQLAPHTDYLFLNEVELELATGHVCRERDGALLRKECLVAMEGLLASGVKRGVVLHTPETAICLDRKTAPGWVDARPLERGQIRSPVGAGDAFCAGALYGLHSQWCTTDTLRLGHAAARANLCNHTATDPIPSALELLGRSSEA